jgi:hypothetical protein
MYQNSLNVQNFRNVGDTPYKRYTARMKVLEGVILDNEIQA